MVRDGRPEAWVPAQVALRQPRVDPVPPGCPLQEPVDLDDASRDAHSDSVADQLPLWPLAVSEVRRCGSSARENLQRLRITDRGHHERPPAPRPADPYRRWWRDPERGAALQVRDRVPPIPVLRVPRSNGRRGCHPDTAGGLARRDRPRAGPRAGGPAWTPAGAPGADAEAPQRPANPRPGPPIDGRADLGARPGTSSRHPGRESACSGRSR